MSRANYLTLIRLAIAPLFLILYTQHLSLGIAAWLLPYVLLAVLGISELSDLFDGYFARRDNQVTDLGKILDPMADSVVRITVFLTFTKGVIQLPLFLPFVIFYRESMISTLRTICALRGFALAARPSGKLKAIIQALAAFIILLAMIPQSLGWITTDTLQSISMVAVSIATVYTILSGIDYILANREHIIRMLVIKNTSIATEVSRG